MTFTVHLHPQRMAAERRKGMQAAGEHDDLLVLAGPADRIEHQVDTAAQSRPDITTLCRRITLHGERVDIEVSASGLYAFLRRQSAISRAADTLSDRSLLLSFSTRLCRIGQGKRLVIDAALPGIPGRPDPKLIKLLVRAHHLKEKLRANPGAHIADLATQEKLSPSYVALLLRLTFLAPDITRAILEGRRPGGFTTQKLVSYAALPFAWAEQRQALSFV